MKVKGKYTVTCTDTRTGEKKVIEQDNLILDVAINDLLGNVRLELSQMTNPSEAYLDSGDAPPQPSDTGLSGNEIDFTKQITEIERTTYDPTKLQRNFKIKNECVFHANAEKTGLVYGILLGNGFREIIPTVSKVSFLEPIDKHEFMELHVIWEFTIINQGVWEGVIEGGSKDGQTDVNWKITVSDRQLLGGLLGAGIDVKDLIIETSNDLPDPINDWNDVRGTQLIKTTVSEQPYETGSFVSIRKLSLETNQANGSIGSLILFRRANPVLRITFDPPLEKDEDHRLYIDFSIGLTRGSSGISGTEMAGMGMSVSGIKWEPAGA
ncbi:MAG: hypothetical protein QM401_05020 [Bacillota bacterium]|nr:hypothetical protein [Bacillota bacterium]